MGVEEIRLVLLIVHAAAGTVALAAGALVLLGRGGGLVHVAALALMTLTLGPSLVLGWDGFPGVTRAIFVGLTVLAAVMTVLGVRALRHRAPGVVSVGQVDLVGFNVISLAVAGTIVPMINLTGNALAVAGVVLVAFLVARGFVQRRRGLVAA